MPKNHCCAADFSSFRVLIFSNGQERLNTLLQGIPDLPNIVDTTVKVDEAMDLIKKNHYNFFIADVSADEPIGKQLLTWVSIHHPGLKPFFLGEQRVPSMMIDIWQLKPTPMLERMNEGVDPLVAPMHILYSEETPVKWMYNAKCECLKMRNRVAESKNRTVLLIGDYGTGKAAMAQIAHFNSERAKGRFVFVNCGREGRRHTNKWSELDEKTFTSALHHVIELSQGGTLYFHDIEMLSKNEQRILVGELKRINAAKGDDAVPLLVICTTKLSMKKADVLLMPELNEQIGDNIMQLDTLETHRSELGEIATQLLRAYCKSLKRTEKHFTQEALNMIVSHNWTDNMRGLFRVIMNAVMLCQGRFIKPEHLDLTNHMDKANHIIGTAHEIIIALERNNGNAKAAAEELGISRNCLYERMKEYGVPTGTGRPPSKQKKGESGDEKKPRKKIQ